ncbi:MAG: LacI family DNA-binding transcriptional regulator [Candidatus Competibacteraceae bacterium]|jgi:LacI family transcriptional regulator|nr:LacI family DNA-binding transcriptional regulator [Candidatus Competibacteraceae bacterium]
MITVKDIANKLGVSPSTVTRALANSSRISPKTKQLVHRTAAEMGYVPNAAAKTMRGKESSLIGLLIPDIENNFYAQIAKAFSEVCNSHDFQLTLAVSDDNPAIEERHIRQLVAARCAGIAIVPTATLTQHSVALLSSRNTAQLIRRNSALNTDWYGIDDVAALRSATNCLLDLNHQRIGLVCGEPALNSGSARYQGYLSALQERNVPIDPALIMRGPPRTHFAQAATNRLRMLSHPPSAIIAAGAGLSEGMLNAVATWSKDDQNAFSLIGYSDSSAFSWWGGSGLTAIALPIHQIAADLCNKLIQLAQDKESKFAQPEDTLYGSHLILRGSVRPYKDISGSVP